MLTAADVTLVKAYEAEHATVASFLAGLATRDQLQRAWRHTATLTPVHKETADDST